MTTTEAIARLREMQDQIIHGSNTFGDIADCLSREAADAAKMREALQDALTCLDGAQYEGGQIFNEEPYALQKKALAIGAGRELLEELEKIKMMARYYSRQASYYALLADTPQAELSTLRLKVKVAEGLAEKAEQLEGHEIKMEGAPCVAIAVEYYEDLKSALDAWRITSPAVAPAPAAAQTPA